MAIPELTITEMTMLINAEWGMASEVEVDPDTIALTDGFVQALVTWRVRMPDGGWEPMQQVVGYVWRDNPDGGEWRIA